MPADYPLSRRKILTFSTAYLAIPAAIRALDSGVKFKAKSLDGQSFTNESTHGKIVLVQFWATWCQYCRRDAPVVDDLTAEFKDQGLIVLAVDVAESKKTVTKYLAQSPKKCSVVLMEDTNLAAWFSPHSFPFYVAIDRNGRAAAEQKGSGGERSLRSLLRKAGLDTEGSDDPGELQSSPRRA